MTGIPQPLTTLAAGTARADLVVGQRHGREAIYRLSDDHTTHAVEDGISYAEQTSVG